MRTDRIGFLSFRPSVYGGAPETLFAMRITNSTKLIEASDLQSFRGIMVTYEVTELLELLRRLKMPPPRILVDISDAERVLLGLSAKSQINKAPWNWWGILNRNATNREDARRFHDWVYSGVYPKTAIEKFALLKEITIALERAWKQIHKGLITAGEEERFFTLEVPVAKVIRERQFQGIRIDPSNLNVRLDQTTEEISNARRILRLKYKIRHDPTTQSVIEVLSKLPEFQKIGLTNVRELRQKISDRAILKLFSDRIPVLTIIRRLLEAERDRRTLLRLGSIGQDRIYPRFLPIGTITSRILIDEPNIQNLRRTNRNILQPEDGNAFLYPDFAQFEPSILAEESGDARLIKHVNEGDLYKPLAKALFGDEAQRKRAKILFLAFCNGMSHEQLIKLAFQVSGLSLKECGEIIDTFFGQYEVLSVWIRNLRDELRSTGRIGTKWGNFRYRTNQQTRLHHYEGRWAISQRIQGTASLILKSAILATKVKVTDANFVLPMHDAVLYQVPIIKLPQVRDELRQVFVASFAQYCPGITARITFEDFGGN